MRRLSGRGQTGQGALRSGMLRCRNTPESRRWFAVEAFRLTSTSSILLSVFWLQIKHESSRSSGRPGATLPDLRVPGIRPSTLRAPMINAAYPALLSHGAPRKRQARRSFRSRENLSAGF